MPIDWDDINADWLKHVDGGKHRKRELAIHAKLERAYAKEEKKKEVARKRVAKFLTDVKEKDTDENAN